MFELLATAEDKQWQLLRGSKLASSLLGQASVFSVTDVIVTPGHTGILANDSKLLLLLDATPEAQYLSEAQEASIEQSIVGGKANRDPEAVCTSRCPLFLLALGTGGRAIHVQFAADKDGSRLRCFVVQEGGRVQAWRWFGAASEQYKWKWIGATHVSEAPLVKLMDARISLADSLVVWCETDGTEEEGSDKATVQKKQRLRLKKLADVRRQCKYRLCWQRLTFDRESVADGREERIVVERLADAPAEETGTILAGFDTIHQVVVTERGIWTLAGGRLACWAFGNTTVQEATWEEGSGGGEQEYTIETTAVDVDTGAPDRRGSLVALDQILGQEQRQQADAEAAPEKQRGVQRTKTKILGAVTIAVNELSQDVLLLEPTGRILVCRSSGTIGGGVTSYLLCTVQQEGVSFTCDEVLMMLAYRHVVVLVTQHKYAVVDAKTGLAFCEHSLPIAKPLQRTSTARETSVTSSAVAGNVWANRLEVGVWAGGEIFRLVPPSVEEYLGRLEELLATLPESNRPVNYLASVSRSWNLTHTSSHYSLKELRRLTSLASESTPSPALVQQQQDIASGLLRHLQNPALVLSLLASIKAHKQFLDTEISTFLQRYAGTEGGDPRLSETWRYLLHTPLNTNVVPLLEAYRKLSVQQSQLSLAGKDDAAGGDAAPREAPTTTSAMAHAVHQDPSGFLQQLEEQMGLPELLASSEPTLPPGHRLRVAPGDANAFGMMVSDEMSASDYFEVLCRLYYSQKPSQLLPLVDLMEKTSGEQWAAAAIAACPPLPSPKGLCHDVYDDFRVDAVVELFQRQKQHDIALRLLLWGADTEAEYVNFWAKAMTMVARAAKDADRKTEHDLLFHIALVHCLATGNAARCRQVLALVPPRLTPLSLLEVVKEMIVPATSERKKLDEELLRNAPGTQPEGEEKVEAEADETPPSVKASGDQLTVGVFKQQLADMFRRQAGPQ